MIYYIIDNIFKKYIVDTFGEYYNIFINNHDNRLNNHVNLNEIIIDNNINN